MSAISVSDTRHIQTEYREFLQIIIKNAGNQAEKWAKDNKHMKKYLTSSVIKYTKTTM